MEEYADTRYIWGRRRRKKACSSSRSEEGERDEGSVSEDGMVMGTYVHGLFDLPSFRSRFLSLAGKGRESAEQIDYESAVEAGIAKVARIVSEHIDVDRIMRIMEEGA